MADSFTPAQLAYHAALRQLWIMWRIRTYGSA